jgi:hypothetical protein
MIDTDTRIMKVSCRSRALAGAALLLAMLLAAAGCKDRPPDTGPTGPITPAATHPAGPWIKAEPNPVPPGTAPGTTTISWSTGDGSKGQVYVVRPLKDEKSPKEDKLFVAGPSGTHAAPWINKKGGKYEFVLYAGTEHKKVLASVTVTRE